MRRKAVPQHGVDFDVDPIHPSIKKRLDFSRALGALPRMLSRLLASKGADPDDTPTVTHVPASRPQHHTGAKPAESLRDAYRVLRRRLRAMPQLRRMMPHLAYVEKTLARHGSAGLKGVPPDVLQAALAQLTQLRPEDEPMHEARSLERLQARLIETIALNHSSKPVPKRLSLLNAALGLTEGTDHRYQDAVVQRPVDPGVTVYGDPELSRFVSPTLARR